jgi:hypothetical protein
MSGGGIAYHLRPNKYVERQLFIELLAMLGVTQNPDKYVYVSLGGPQLEDQRLVHHNLGIKSLISLEEDETVVGRQKFNRRPSYVDCRHQSTQDFVDNFDQFIARFTDKVFIIWLDYASARHRLAQIIEYRTLLGKLAEGDIVKITINANPETLAGPQPNESMADLQKRRADILSSKFYEYLPTSTIDPSLINVRGLPILLCSIVKQATLLALEAHNPRLRALPLGIFCYSDGHHQMLTVTIILKRANDTDVEILRNDLHLSQWLYLPEDWTNVKRIEVPMLTAKERLFLEELLFTDSHEAIHSRMPFKFDQEDDQSLKILQNYAEHYRRYPSYFQVHI